MPLLTSCGCGRYLNELHVKYKKLDEEMKDKFKKYWYARYMG